METISTVDTSPSIRFHYRLLEGGAVIVKCETSATSLEIPSTLEGHPVKGVADSAFERMFTLKRASLPEGLVSIGAHAFRSCVTLREVELPSTLQTVGSEAFRATALERLSIPAACTSVENDSFCLQGSWQAPPSTVRPSTLKSISVSANNPALIMEGGLLCRVEGRGLRAIMCANANLDVAIGGRIETVLPAAFTGVEHIRSLTISERVRAANRDVVFPSTSCDSLTLECADGADFTLSMPSEDAARKTLASLFRARRVDIGQALGAFDDSLKGLPDKIALARAMLDRLSSARFLTQENEKRYRRFIASSMEAVCLGFASESYWRGFDALVDCGLLESDGISHIVDLLAQYGETAASGYLLEAKRRRFGKVTWDYDI